ncbi:MAG: hypothetical protein JWO42_2140 [Chloroflexi bacterium]|nr:hypothetical protein [Chloroflexota bacterium]
MRRGAKAEDAPVLSENIEPMRIWIRQRIAVGGGQHDEHGVAPFHPLSGNQSILGKKAAGVLDRRVMAQNLRDHEMEEAGISLDLLAHDAMPGQGNERIANQPRRGLVRSREEADTVREDRVRVVAPDPPCLSRPP